MSKFFGFLKAKKWLAVILACVGVGIIGVAGFAIYTATHADIMPNVRVENLALGGMTREEAIEAMGAIDEEYGASTFNITAADTITPVVGKELNVRLDKEAVADEAIKVGHEGNLWQRMLATAKTLTSGHEIAPVVVLDEDLLGVIIERVSAANVEPQDATFRVEKDQLILTPPVDGKHFDIEALKTRIREKFQEKDYGDMVLTMEPWEAKPINLDEVYAEVHTEAKDAVIETKDGKKVLTPHVVGVDFDLAAAKEKLAQTPDEEIRITLTLTQPKVTTASLQSSNELFGHTLSKVTTRYSAKKTNRVSNVKLAAKLINGTVLNPGEVFSYNKVVGPRTTARGFKAAAIFAAGEVVDGIGGGICQVSSTLYMASIYADLETVKRTNHSFYVDYAPKGHDATVVYGSIDFQFKNNTDAPIKIFASANNTSVTVTIKGTASTKKTVKLQTKTISTTPFTEKTVVDPALKPGERVVRQAGQNGMRLEVYRVVYDENGKVLRNEHENTTRYKPMPQIVSVGPEAPAVAPQQQPAQQQPTQQQPTQQQPTQQQPTQQQPAQQQPTQQQSTQQQPTQQQPTQQQPTQQQPTQQQPAQQQPTQQQPAQQQPTQQQPAQQQPTETPAQ